VLNLVFPKRPATEWPIVDAFDKPQGLGSHEHRDYWRLFLGTADLLASESDQQVLRAISEWNDAKSTSLVSEMANYSFGYAVLHFVRLLKNSRLPPLLVAVVRSRIGESPALWSEAATGGDAPPGIVALSRLCQQKLETRGLDQPALARAVEEVLHASVPSNLRLGQQIVFFLTEGSHKLRY